jgi:hypothetical protein
MKISNVLPRFAILAASLLVSQAYAAAAFTPTDPDTGVWIGEQPLGYIGPIELSNSSLAGGVKAYRGWFENGAWQGDLIEYDVTATGGLSTSIDLTGTSPVQGATPTNWSAFIQFDSADGDSPTYNTYWNIGRKIITRNDNTGLQVPFRWNKISATQQAAVDLTQYNADVAGATVTDSNLLKFIRGDRSLEFPVGIYRSRFSLLGDIIHSRPEYVQIPNADIPDSSYVTFINDNVLRAPRVYVGANDGMMHAFDALTGNEVWAYIPSLVVDNLSKMASRPFSHTYYVDGGTTVSDAYFDTDWHTLLIGSLGGGGKGLYALDITNPDLTAETSTADADKKVLGELDSKDATYGDDVGFIFGSAVIAKLSDGDWYVISGNGVSSVNGIAKLFLINLETGGVKTLVAGGANGNGLSAPAVVDTDSDGKADVVYAGDIDGDLWKFDLTDVLPANWSAGTYKLYDGVDTQPITTAPDVTTHPVSGLLVLVGTGRLYTASDIKDTSTQSLFGIWDKGVAPTSDVKLAQAFSENLDYSNGTIGETVRTITTTAPINWATHTGWKIDLPAGERLITSPQLRSGRIKATTTNPDGFENWLVEVRFDDGGSADGPIFDLDQNGLLERGTPGPPPDPKDSADGNIIPDLDLDDPEDIPMAWQRRNGNMSQATIARIGQGIDTLFLNYLNPAIIPPGCTGDCEGGIGGGHIDVDYDTELGGDTDGHEHEYDDTYDRTYVDYFDIDSLAAGKLKSVDHADVGIGANDQFVILIANADLSPGSELTIGTQKINVVEYQRMIHKALAAWDGVDTATLKDASFGSLVFKLPAIKPPGGTLRSTFDSLAIVNGGLHPTLTGCVNKDNGFLTVNGRWRNGSLVIQLVSVDAFDTLGTASALDRVIVQSPTDMYKSVIVGGEEIVLAEDLSDPADGDTDDLYEVYGGLLAATDADFLYESTLFWHFGDVTKLVLGKDATACYGDEPAWSTAAALERNGIPLIFFNDLLIAAGFVDVDGLADLPALITAFNALLASGCDITKGSKDDGCKEDYTALLELVELSERVEGSDSSDDDISTGLEGAGTTPVTIEGAVTTGGVTSGPNFQTGRRTWIDILPE